MKQSAIRTISLLLVTAVCFDPTIASAAQYLQAPLSVSQSGQNSVAVFNQQALQAGLVQAYEVVQSVAIRIRKSEGSEAISGLKLSRKNPTAMMFVWSPLYDLAYKAANWRPKLLGWLPSVVSAFAGFTEDFALRWLAVHELTRHGVDPWISTLLYATVFATVFHPKVYVGTSRRAQNATFTQRTFLFLGAAGLGALVQGLSGIPSMPIWLPFLVVGLIHGLYNPVARILGLTLGMPGNSPEFSKDEVLDALGRMPGVIDIIHPKFGKGRVIKMMDSEKAVVEFVDGKRTLNLRIAPFEIADEPRNKGRLFAEIRIEQSIKAHEALRANLQQMSPREIAFYIVGAKRIADWRGELGEREYKALLDAIGEIASFWNLPAGLKDALGKNEEGNYNLNEWLTQQRGSGLQDVAEFFFKTVKAQGVEGLKSVYEQTSRYLKQIELDDDLPHVVTLLENKVDLPEGFQLAVQWQDLWNRLYNHLSVYEWDYKSDADESFWEIFYGLPSNIHRSLLLMAAPPFPEVRNDEEEGDEDYEWQRAEMANEYISGLATLAHLLTQDLPIKADDPILPLLIALFNAKAISTEEVVATCKTFLDVRATSGETFIISYLRKAQDLQAHGLLPLVEFLQSPLSADDIRQNANRIEKAQLRPENEMDKALSYAFLARSKVVGEKLPTYSEYGIAFPVVTRLWKPLAKELETVPIENRNNLRRQIISETYNYAVKFPGDDPDRTAKEIEAFMKIVHSNLPLCLASLSHIGVRLQEIDSLRRTLHNNNALTRILRMLGEPPTTVGGYFDIVSQIKSSGHFSDLIDLIVWVAESKGKSAPYDVGGILQTLREYSRQHKDALATWTEDDWARFSTDVKDFYDAGFKVLTHKFFTYFREHKDDPAIIAQFKETLQSQLESAGWGSFFGLTDEARKTLGITAEDEIALLARFIQITNLSGRDFQQAYDEVRAELYRRVPANWQAELPVAFRTLYSMKGTQTETIYRPLDPQDPERLALLSQKLPSYISRLPNLTLEEILKSLRSNPDAIRTFVVSLVSGVQGGDLREQMRRFPRSPLDQQDWLTRWGTLLTDTLRDQRNLVQSEFAKRIDDSNPTVESAELALTDLGFKAAPLPKINESDKERALQSLNDSSVLSQTIRKTWNGGILGTSLTSDAFDAWIRKNFAGLSSEDATKIRAACETAKEAIASDPAILDLRKRQLAQRLMEKSLSLFDDQVTDIQRQVKCFTETVIPSDQDLYVGFFDDLLHLTGEFMMTGVCTWASRVIQVKTGNDQGYHFGTMALKDETGRVLGFSQVQVSKVPLAGAEP